MNDPILFLDRDGTIIKEPEDNQIDSLSKLSLVDDVIPELIKLRDAGFRFVLVSNQDGLGTLAFPRQKFEEAHGKLLEILSSQGISFLDQCICPHLPSERCECRKPRLGLVHAFLLKTNWDRERSAVIGDRDTDLALAKNMGLKGYKLGTRDQEGLSWRQISSVILGEYRSVSFERKTNETKISGNLRVDGSGISEIATGLGFFDHMLEQLAKHSGIDIQLKCDGDLQVDAHHTMEDVGIALGAAMKRALGSKRGIERYGFTLPMDEALAMVAIDLSGRFYFKWSGELSKNQIGQCPTEMFPHFFRSFAEAMGVTLHITVSGDNSHHMVESVFKGVGRALRLAKKNTGLGDLPSTKGIL